MRPCTRLQERLRTRSKRWAMTTLPREAQPHCGACNSKFRGPADPCDTFTEPEKVANFSYQHHRLGSEVTTKSPAVAHGTVTTRKVHITLSRGNAFLHPPQYARRAATPLGPLQDCGNHTEYVRRLMSWSEPFTCVLPPSCRLTVM